MRKKKMSAEKIMKENKEEKVNARIKVILTKENRK